ncbi:MAG: hypothetical protein ABR552_07600, partial [Actinomycetota bacterium]
MKTLRRAAIAGFLALIVTTWIGVGAASAASLVTDFTQCSNLTTSPHSCSWINGIIQQSNSRYFEGMGVPQRTFFDNVTAQPSNAHTLVFHHDATKGGIHAYDWLESYSQAIQGAIDAGVPFTTLNPCVSGSSSPASFAADCIALRGGSNFIDIPVPDDSYVSHDGATQTRINAYELAYGNRTVRVWANAPISGGTLTLSHSVANGLDTSDSAINYSLGWTSAATKILIEYAGHIARADGAAGWGAGHGASSISGGPYHVSLDTLDGASLGSQDNQIKGADILIASSIVTTPVPSTSVVVNNPIHDTAVITGSSPSGTVTFRLYGPSSSASCTGTPIYTSAVPVTNITTTSGSATSGNYTPTAPGSYWWTATYSGDTGNSGSASGCGDETNVVTKATPTLATAPNAATVVVGNPISDTATLTGGFNPTGTVSFALFGPGDTGCT